MDCSSTLGSVTVTLIAELQQSAASGVVCTGNELLVVADDELTLARYDSNGRPLGTIRLLSGHLPQDPVQRKRRKRDFEAIVVLEERVLVLGSGSKRRRNVGVLVDMQTARTIRVDLEPLYEKLEAYTDRVNVEGAALIGDKLVLLMRRTGSRGRNLLVMLDAERVLAGLCRSEARLDERALSNVVAIELGDLDGVPLGFTDAAVCGPNLLFSAAAEATDDPVHDGACSGSILGLVSLDGRVLERARLNVSAKIEGVCTVAAASRALELRLVADPDDPTRRAPLFAAPFPFRELSSAPQRGVG